MTKPITPAEAGIEKLKKIPPEVVEAFNELIVENLEGGSATVMQSDAVKRIQSKLTIQREAIFKKGWLDVEPLFEQHGWSVEFDKPGYNETYEAHFTFSKKRKRG